MEKGSHLASSRDDATAIVERNLIETAIVSY